MRLALRFALAAGVALAACQKPDSPEALPSGGATSPPIGAFAAVSGTAMRLTGDLTGTAAGELRFDQGQAYQLVADGKARGADRFAGTGETWSGLMGVPKGAQVRIFRVEERRAARGGLCGQDPATFLAISEGSDPGGAPALFLAAFRGDRSPGPAGLETNLCGTFLYAPKPAVVEASEK